MCLVKTLHESGLSKHLELRRHDRDGVGLGIFALVVLVVSCKLTFAICQVCLQR